MPPARPVYGAQIMEDPSLQYHPSSVRFDDDNNCYIVDPEDSNYAIYLDIEDQEE